MIGDLTSRQILALSNDGLSPAIIARELSIEEAFVRLVLAKHNAGTSEDRDINDEQLKILRSEAYSLATGAEDEGVRAKMTMYLIDRDKPKRVEQISPITLINQAIIQAQAAYQEELKEIAK